MKKGISGIFILGVVLLSGCGTASDGYNQMDSEVIRPKNDTVSSVQNDDTKGIKVKNEDTSDKRPVVMFEGCPQRDVDVPTFKALNASYAKDKNGVYWLGRPGCDLLKIEGADLKTFVAVNIFFGKDKNFVYTGDRKIEGADVKTFTIAKLPNIPEGMCGQDKSGYYSALHLTEDTNGNLIDEKCAKIK